MFCSPFIRPNDGKTQPQRQKAALHYSLFFNSIVLKYAVFSKNNCLFDWCAGFLMIFKERFFFTLMKQITAVRAELNSFHKVAAKDGFPVRNRIKSPI